MGTITWRELNDLFYQKFPEEWEKETLCLDHEWAHDIYDGKGSRYLRLVQNDEKVTDTYIKRVNRKIWEVGCIYHVRRESEVIGQLKLVRIEYAEKRRWFKPVKPVAWLIFEKVKND